MSNLKAFVIGLIMVGGVAALATATLVVGFSVALNALFAI